MLKQIIRRLLPPRVPGEVPLSKIARYLPTNPVVVEAGAHIGIDTQRIAHQWPKGRIFAFEPIVNIYKQLAKNTGDLKNVTTYKLAIGDVDGRAKIHVSGGRSDGSSSILQPKEHLNLHPDVTFEKATEIQIVSLDSWAAKEKINKVDFLWLDLQGYELAALKGAKHMLKNVSAIHTEVNLVEVYKGAPLYKDLRKWLQGRGFKVAFEAIDWDDGGNVLFVRKIK